MCSSWCVACVFMYVYIYSFVRSTRSTTCFLVHSNVLVCSLFCYCCAYRDAYTKFVSFVPYIIHICIRATHTIFFPFRFANTLFACRRFFRGCSFCCYVSDDAQRATRCSCLVLSLSGACCTIHAACEFTCWAKQPSAQHACAACLNA